MWRCDTPRDTSHWKSLAFLQLVSLHRPARQCVSFPQASQCVNLFNKVLVAIEKKPQQVIETSLVFGLPLDDVQELPLDHPASLHGPNRLLHAQPAKYMRTRCRKGCFSTSSVFVHRLPSNLVKTHTTFRDVYCNMSCRGCALACFDNGRMFSSSSTTRQAGQSFRERTRP